MLYIKLCNGHDSNFNAPYFALVQDLMKMTWYFFWSYYEYEYFICDHVWVMM